MVLKHGLHALRPYVHQGVVLRGFAKGFQKGGFGRCSPVPRTGTRVHSDVPRYQEPERGCIRMFPGTGTRNEGTFAKTTLLQNHPFVSSRFLKDAAFLLTVGSFLLTVGLFLLTVDNFSFFTYTRSFSAYSFSFATYSWSFFAYNGKVRLIRALRDCKQRSLTVSKKAPTLSQKASAIFKKGRSKWGLSKWPSGPEGQKKIILARTHEKQKNIPHARHFLRKLSF